MLLWLFRGVFIVIVVSVLVVNASSVELSKTENSASWWSVVISGVGLTVFFLFLDVLTPSASSVLWRACSSGFWSASSSVVRWPTPPWT